MEFDPERKKEAPEPETSNLLKSLRQAHILLYDVMKHINDIYKVHFLVSMFSFLSIILFNLYYSIFGFITLVKDVPDEINYNGVILSIVWMTYVAIRFVMLVTVAHFTVVASNETKYIISKIEFKKFEFLSRQEVSWKMAEAVRNGKLLISINFPSFLRPSLSLLSLFFFFFEYSSKYERI